MLAMRCLLPVLIVTAACNAKANAPGPSEPSSGGPALESVTPDSGPAGARVVLRGSGFRETGNAVKLGEGYVKDLPSSDGRTLVFEVPDGVDACPPAPTGPCPGAYPRLKPGRYEISVVTPSGTSSGKMFTVTE